MTEYYITAVKTDDTGDRIRKVKHRRNLSTVSGSRTLAKKNIVKDIEQGKTIKTATKTHDDYEEGQSVHVVDAGGDKFLRIDKSQIMEDDLGDLPEF